MIDIWLGILENLLVDKIHATPTKVVLFIAGGGLGIFEVLTHRGGGSATLLAGLIPNDPEETIELLGHTPEKLASEETARTMAMVAFQRALKRSKGNYPVIGVACSSVLQKTPYERVGRKHLVYAALQTDSKTISCVLDLGEGVSEPNQDGEILRMTEEKITVRLILNLIAEGCGLKEQVRLGYDCKDSDLCRRESGLIGVSISKILQGSAVPFDCYDNGEIITNHAVCQNEPWPCIFPGSFNPIHSGHWEMCELAMDMMNKDIEFEISLTNVDKPALDLISLEKRLQGFCHSGKSHGPIRVWVSNAATFTKKCEQFHNATFIVGYDTAKRICDPKYDKHGDLNYVFHHFRSYHARFLVFGREINGVYNSGLDEFPEQFRALATACIQPRKYTAISSSEIRRITSKG